MSTCYKLPINGHTQSATGINTLKQQVDRHTECVHIHIVVSRCRHAGRAARAHSVAPITFAQRDTLSQDAIARTHTEISCTSTEMEKPFGSRLKASGARQAEGLYELRLKARRAAASGLTPLPLPRASATSFIVTNKRVA